MERFFHTGGEYAARRGGYEAFSQKGGKGKGKAVDEAIGRGSLEVLNNLEWTEGVGMLEFLRTVGKMARVNVMLARDR